MDDFLIYDVQEHVAICIASLVALKQVPGTNMREFLDSYNPEETRFKCRGGETIHLNGQCTLMMDFRDS